MQTAAPCPRAVGRHLVAAMAGLMLLVHGVLEPAHLVSHHGGTEEQGHLASHQGEHAGHQHHDGGPVDHSDEHDSGDHGGTGHLLEVVPHPGPVAGLNLDVSGAALPGEAPLLLLASARKSFDTTIEELRPRPPPRGTAPSRAPPIG